ncbi:MAG TPA: hypothetical protein VN958_06390 [Chitinophagaceae bacterium]|nr:hypothetical protein [Chitinophagaceae bacterium]
MNNVELQVQKEIIQTVNADLLPETSINGFLEKLTAYIGELINHDLEKLVNILYRLDVSEKKLKETLESSSSTDAGLLIATMIFERQLQKIKSRKQFTQQDKNIADEDKW